MKQIIPIPLELNIEEFSGALITNTSSYIENGVIEEYPEKKLYVTQRPSFTKWADASTGGGDSQGRGIYYWRRSDNTYICNYDTIYYDSYSTACSGSMPAAGSQRVYFAELGDYLVCLDPQGNAGYYTTSGTPTVWAAISDASFPDATIGTLNDGVAVLDNTLYALNTDASGSAFVYGSDLLNPTSWVGTNLLAAYKNPDKGVYIGTHHSSVFVLGNESCEFFYDAGNATGSPLSARQDVSYNIGCADGKSVFIDNDEVFFVGKSTTSGLGVFKLSNFQIEKISPTPLDSYLSTAVTNSSMSTVGSGVFAGGKTFYVLTLYETVSGTISPIETIVYNTRSKTWTFWEHAASDISQFPLVSWTTANAVSGIIVSGKGILSNGDVLECFDDFYPQDRSAGVLIYETGVFESGIYETVSDDGDQIEMKIRMGHIDFDTRNKKFMHELRPVCDTTENAQTLYVKYSDDRHNNFTSERTLDLSNANDKLTRLGQFRSRTFELRYAGDEKFRFEGLEVEVVGAGV